jgi:glycosyltransferase involved in cell wall biosynthesis
VYHLANGLARKHEVTLVSVTHPQIDGPAVENDALFGRCVRNIVFRKCPRNAWNFAHVATNWGPLPQRLWTLLSSLRPSRVRDANDPDLVTLLRNIRLEEAYDAVWVSMDIMGENARRAGFDRIVLDLPDVDSLCYSSILRQRGWYLSKPLHYGELAKIWIHEKRLPRRFWRLVVCRSEEVTFFRGSEERVHVVPNGVAEFKPTSPRREHSGELLFVGTLNYQPNVDAVQYFCRSILPLIRQQHHHARLVVVGLKPAAEVLALHNGQTIEVVGTVDDVAPFFESASIVVTPIRSGAGTRLKILEALVRGKAVVSTSKGIEGLELTDGTDLMMADSPEQFAAACMALLADADKRRSLAASGRAHALERYHWDRSVEAAERALGIRADSNNASFPQPYMPSKPLTSGV